MQYKVNLIFCTTIIFCNQPVCLLINFFYLHITCDWVDSISAYIHNFLLTIVHMFLTNYHIIRILRMYNVLQIHITNMVRAISLQSIEFLFSYFDSFLILINIWSQFGEQWAGWDDVSQVSWICFVVDADCTYLTYLLLMAKM